LRECIKEKKTSYIPIWFMRQAGRYLPEFREIRKNNPNFINLCLRTDLVAEITTQPLKRFDLDAAIIFSDILMLPFGLGQKVEFKKNFGPLLGDLNLNKFQEINEDDFTKKLNPVYNAIKKVKKDKLLINKDVIGFVGAPWTLLVYMLNNQSPKNNLNKEILKDRKKINKILNIINKFLKIHIKNQIDSGATLIQIFDSWAGIADQIDIKEYIYEPTEYLVNFIKSLNIPTICFPRNIKNYKEYTNIVKPDVINIDYNIDPKQIKKQIDIVVQGGLDPKLLIGEKENLKKEVNNYLNIFKDHPYIFNLGHGVLPETNPENVNYLVNLVKEF